MARKTKAKRNLMDRWGRHRTAIAATLAAAALACPATAAADPPGHGGAAPTSEGAVLEALETSPQQALWYWTRARREDAEPLPTPVLPGGPAGEAAPGEPRHRAPGRRGHAASRRRRCGGRRRPVRPDQAERLRRRGRHGCQPCPDHGAHRRRQRRIDPLPQPGERRRLRRFSDQPGVPEVHLLGERHRFPGRRPGAHRRPLRHQRRNRRRGEADRLHPRLARRVRPLWRLGGGREGDHEVLGRNGGARPERGRRPGAADPRRQARWQERSRTKWAASGSPSTRPAHRPTPNGDIRPPPPTTAKSSKARLRVDLGTDSQLRLHAPDDEDRQRLHLRRQRRPLDDRAGHGADRRLGHRLRLRRRTGLPLRRLLRHGGPRSLRSGLRHPGRARRRRSLHRPGAGCPPGARSDRRAAATAGTAPGRRAPGRRPPRSPCACSRSATTARAGPRWCW